MFGYLYWLVFAAVAWAIALLLVPRERIIQLFPIGLAAGFVLSFLIQLIGVTWLGLWVFNNPLIPVAGIPILLPVAYIAEVIIFAHMLPISNWGRIFYVVIFSLGNALITYFTVSFGQQEFIYWGFTQSFVIAVVSHVLALYITVAWRSRASL